MNDDSMNECNSIFSWLQPCKQIDSTTIIVNVFVTVKIHSLKSEYWEVKTG